MPIRYLVGKYRHYLAQVRHFVLHNVLHADDPPRALALGAAIGVFVAFTPTIGLQMVLVVFLAWLVGANKAIGLPIVWISNPATAVPMYYSCYVVGRKILGHEQVGSLWWHHLANPPLGWWPRVSFYWSRMMDIAEPLWLGSIVIGVVAAVPTYYLVNYVVRFYRLKHWGQLIRPKRRSKKRGTPPPPKMVESK